MAGAELQADSRGIDPCSRMTGLANLAGSLVKQNTFVSRSTAGYGEPEQWLGGWADFSRRGGTFLKTPRLTHRHGPWKKCCRAVKNWSIESRAIKLRLIGHKLNSPKKL